MTDFTRDLSIRALHRVQIFGQTGWGLSLARMMILYISHTPDGRYGIEAPSHWTLYDCLDTLRQYEANITWGRNHAADADWPWYAWLRDRVDDFVRMNFVDGRPIGRQVRVPRGPDPPPGVRQPQAGPEDVTRAPYTHPGATQLFHAAPAATLPLVEDSATKQPTEQAPAATQSRQPAPATTRLPAPVSVPAQTPSQDPAVGQHFNITVNHNYTFNTRRTARSNAPIDNPTTPPALPVHGNAPRRFRHDTHITIFQPGSHLIQDWHF